MWNNPKALCKREVKIKSTNCKVNLLPETSARAWNNKIDGIFNKMSLIGARVKPSLYVKK